MDMMAYEVFGWLIFFFIFWDLQHQFLICYSSKLFQVSWKSEGRKMYTSGVAFYSSNAVWVFQWVSLHCMEFWRVTSQIFMWQCRPKKQSPFMLRSLIDSGHHTIQMQLKVCHCVVCSISLLIWYISELLGVLHQ